MKHSAQLSRTHRFMRYSAFLLSFASAAVLAGCNSANPPTAPDAVIVEPGTGTQPAASSSVSGRFVGVGHSGMGGVKFNKTKRLSQFFKLTRHVHFQTARAMVSLTS